MNFAEFYSNSVKEKNKKIKKGKYRGQPKSVKSKNLSIPGSTFTSYVGQPSLIQAPSANTYTVRG